MKKNNLFNLAAIFAGISILFSIVYEVLFIFFFNYGAVKDSSNIWELVISGVITVVFTVLLIIGIVTQKKIFFLFCYGCYIIYNLFYALYNLVNSVLYEPEYYIHIVFSSLSSLMINICMLLFILGMFKWKEKLDSVNTMIAHLNHAKGNDTMNQADKLMEYKELLDIGAISEEEFEAKKKEIMH